MRLTIAVLVLVWLPAAVAAQSRHAGAPMGVPLPQIGFPLPSIGLPPPPTRAHVPRTFTPSIGLPRAIDRQPRVGKARPLRDIGNRPRRFGQKPSIRQHSTVVYVVPAYGFDYLPPVPAGAPTQGDFPDAISEYREERPLIGVLWLEVEPEAVLQLYVDGDGDYVGTPSDFNSEVTLDAGRHTIELRAPGYETFQFDADIAPDRSITYRGALKPASAPPPPADVARRTPTTFYVIPGCYAGNVPPKDAGLPATCDHSRVITFKP